MTSHRDVPGIQPCLDRRGEWRNTPMMTSIVAVIYTVDGSSDMLLHQTFFTISFPGGVSYFRLSQKSNPPFFWGISSSNMAKHVIVLMKNRENHES